MAEAGGPATQAGIFFQNSVAALYLGRMLDLRPRSARYRVIQVRVEAPEEVDDIVVRLGDGTRQFIQAKLTIQISSDTWTGLWTSFSRQIESVGVAPEDRFALVVGEVSALAHDLRACCERTASAADDAEYLGRLTAAQQRVVDSILDALRGRGYELSRVRRLLARTDVEIMVDPAIERDYAPLWMPVASESPGQLLGHLRDMVGGASRIRGSFDAATLRALLKEQHGIEVPEPGGWGSAHYRTVLSGRALIEVPGTSIVKPISDAFLWPRATRYDRTRRPDFDDETPRSVVGIRSDEVDLSLFPGPGLDRLVVIAGPGLGKSVLTLALAAQAVQNGLLPALISIPELSRLDVDIGTYLREHLNKAFEVAIDWKAAAESGLLVLLLDGLDEVSSDRRAVTLERIKTFSLRHAQVPWLLTVRDAAALTAPTDALFVELEPLDDNDIQRFVELYRPEDPNLPERLSRRFKVRPDLQRLVRIPLFLAILLASMMSPEELPSSRTELLEVYLDLLFRPEQFKRGETDAVDPTVLRSIAEAIAFEALERDEIGVGARLLHAAVRHHLLPGAPVQPVIEKLVKCGVLRRASPGRYVFPFPVVQEYLAAHYILENRLAQVSERLSSAVKRPWAQVLQFVLELHPTPSSLVGDLLAHEDDAFNTNLRLLARCVANGMSVSPDVRQEIARRLAAIWPRSSWRMRDRIGDLISEAFSDPLTPEVRAQLSNRSLLHHGSGAVVARIGDRSLTRAVLKGLLAGNVEHLLNLAELQAPVSVLGDEALSLYAGLARAPHSSEVERDAMASLIGHLDGRLVSENARLSVALDEDLPHSIRLAAFALGPTPIDPRAFPLIEAALATTGFQPRSSAAQAIARVADPAAVLRSALMRTDVPMEDRLEIINYLPRALPNAQLSDIVRKLARNTALSQELRYRLLVFAARYGDGVAMAELIDRSGDLSVEIVGATISIFGHYRSRPMVESVVKHLSGRALTPRDRVDLTASAVLGMTALFEMDWYRGGLIKPAPPHPGLTAFRPLLEIWGAMTDYAPLDALRMDEELAQLGSEPALAQIPDRIEQVLQANDVDMQDHNQASIVGHGLRTLRERQHILSLRFLESVIARSSYNAASSAVDMIAAHGTREALDSLLAAHDGAQDAHLKGVILDNIETLAGRLGLRVRKMGSRLEAAVG